MGENQTAHKTNLRPSLRVEKIIGIVLMASLQAPSQTLIVLEDSSTASLGGGQRVTLEVMKALYASRRIRLFDFAHDSVFLRLALPFVGSPVRILAKRPSRLVSGRIFSALSTLFFGREWLRTIINHAREEQIGDPIIYATTTKTLALAYFLWLIKGFSYVFHAHLIYPKSSPFYWILRPAFTRARLILCVSKAVMRQLPGKRRLLYNAVTLPPAKPRILPTTKVVVATFSGLVRFKGIQYFMESYRFLKHVGRVECRVYGDGAGRDGLRRFESEHVRVMGFANDVPALLADEISLVVIPSLISEACPMTLLEALSFGIPVIGTNKGGLAELLKDGEIGFQVSPKHPAAIAEKIDYFIENPDVYETFSANALEYVKQFDLETYKETVRGLFQSL